MRIYLEWLQLPKKAFELLIRLRLSDNAFSGRKADMCRLMNVSNSGNNRTAIIDTINHLANLNFINCEHKDGERNWSFSIRELETESVECSNDLIKNILQGGFNYAVSPVIVIKTLAALVESNGEMFTQKELGVRIGCSGETVANALNVLSKDFNAINTEAQYREVENGHQRAGTTAIVGAFFIRDN